MCECACGTGPHLRTDLDWTGTGLLYGLLYQVRLVFVLSWFVRDTGNHATDNLGRTETEWERERAS